MSNNINKKFDFYYYKVNLLYNNNNTNNKFRKWILQNLE